MTDRVDTLFDEYAARWARGEHPDAAEYLEQAGDDRDDLALLIDGYLSVAPAQEPDEETVRFFQLFEADEPPLFAARVARGLRREDVVQWILTSFSLPADKAEKVSAYWHELEIGLLSPSDVAPDLWRRVVELIGRKAEAASSFRLMTSAPRVIFERRQDTDFSHSVYPTPAEPVSGAEPDEVDRLFGYVP